MKNDFKTVIGLEVHIELSTNTKMFCSCDNNAEGKQPNELTCPVCFGMPGTLPVINKQAIISAIKMGQALGCKIAEFSKFDRKHYFYPDLPKGYQISQYDKPICIGGSVEAGESNIRLNRIHLEEDAGKLIHLSSGLSEVDLNRAGTPLIEIVSEPDIESPENAKEFLKEIQLTARIIGISMADMEKGHLRCDANINVIKDGKSSPIVEIKNLNSFKFVQKALEFEKLRLIENFDSFDGRKTKQTRGFDSSSGKTYPLREKEEAKDYRYFPEPDLPPIDTTSDPDFDPKKIKLTLPKLPPQLRKEYSALGLSSVNINKIIADDNLREIFAEAIDRNSKYAVNIANLILNDKNVLKMNSGDIAELAELIQVNNIPSNLARKIVEETISSGKKPSQCYTPENDTIDLDEIVQSVMDENQDALEKLKAGKSEIIGFLIGQAMKKSGGKGNPGKIKEKIIEKTS